MNIDNEMHKKLINLFGEHVLVREKNTFKSH